LDQEFCLYTSRGFGFPFTSSTGQRINFVNENDGWLLFSGHLEQLFDEPAHISTVKPMALITYLSDSPIHLETKSLLDTEKKVLFASVATAFAKKLLPVPGGP
jgi:hypothetical protein